MVKEKLRIHIDDSVNEILHEVDKVSYLLDENVHKEKYDQVKKFDYDIISARYNIEDEVERRMVFHQASRSKPDKVEDEKSTRQNSILEENSSEMQILHLMN